MSALDLSIVIVNYNSAPLVRRCLSSLGAGASGLGWEVVVVDNASPRPGVEALTQELPTVRLVRRATNGGFAAGANAGIRAARADTVLLLNPDTRVQAGAVSQMLGYLRANPDIGVVGPRLVNPDGSLQLSCRRFPTLHTGLFNRYSLLTRLMPRNRYSAHYLMTDWDHHTVRDVDWLSGAAMMIPRRALDRAGMFDEAYFFAIEDVDLCRRMHTAGLRVVYFPQAVVEHCIGGSSATLAGRVVVARHRGMWRYYRRYLGGRPALDMLTAAAITGRCLVQLALLGTVRVGRALRERRPPRQAGAQTGSR